MLHDLGITYRILGVSLCADGCIGNTDSFGFSLMQVVERRTPLHCSSPQIGRLLPIIARIAPTGEEFVLGLGVISMASKIQKAFLFHLKNFFDSSWLKLIHCENKFVFSLTQNKN